MVITGITLGAPMAPANPPPAGDRQRLSLDLAPTVSLLLDHVSVATGVPKSQVVLQAVLDALPALLERADAIRKRHGELARPQGGKR
jgi:hypothetical protein